MQLSSPPLGEAGEDFGTALSQARSAVELLAQLHIAPNAARLTVAFAHQSGENQEMSRTLNRLLARDKLTATAIDELYEEYFGTLLDEAELRDASKRIGKTAADMADYIDVATDKVSRYGTVLQSFAGSTGHIDVPEEGFRMVAELSQAIGTVLDETRKMAETNSLLEERLQISSREIELLREHLDLLEREASMDALTGIANRKSFDVILRETIAEAGRERQPLALLMIDIDHFKAFNDVHGHQIGDHVLRLVAQYMYECVKGRDTVARYGGEEFAIILPHTGLETAMQTADMIRRHVSAKKVVNRRTGRTLGQITLSIGTAEYRQGEPASELVHRADEALYLAKSVGRNRVCGENDQA